MRTRQTFLPIFMMLLSIVLATSCSRKPGEEYYPKNSKGSQCEYSIEYTRPGAGVQKGKMSVRNDGEEVIRGKAYFKLVTVFAGIPGAESQVNYYRRTDEGIYSISGKHKDQPEYLETPFPLQVGKNWTVKTSDAELTYRVEGVETAELFDKSYDNCLKVSFSGSRNSMGTKVQIEGYSYRAPKVGEVKSVTKLSREDLFIEGPAVVIDVALERCH